MSDTNAQEPTMEEILASIRRIISEDDAPAAAADEAEEEEDDGEVSAPASARAAASEDEDVLELTDPEPAPPRPSPIPPPQPAEALGDIEVFPRAGARPEPAPAPAPAAFAAPPVAGDEEDALISGAIATQAASAFSQLSRTVAMPAEGRTIEDVVREMLRPMLKDWLDTHLPGIVETAVQAEVERISRRRV